MVARWSLHGPTARHIGVETLASERSFFGHTDQSEQWSITTWVALPGLIWNVAVLVCFSGFRFNQCQQSHRLVWPCHVKMNRPLSPPRSRSPDEVDDNWILIRSTPKQSLWSDRPLPVPPARMLPLQPKYRGHQLTLGGLLLPPPRTQPKSLQAKPPENV